MKLFVENRFESINYEGYEKVELPVYGATVYLDIKDKEYKLDNLSLYHEDDIKLSLSGGFNRYSIENYLAKKKDSYPEGIFRVESMHYLLDFIDPDLLKINGNNHDVSKLLDAILKRIKNTDKKVINDYCFEFVAENSQSERLIINTNIVDSSKTYMQKVNLADKNLELTIQVFNNRKVLKYLNYEGFEGIISIFPSMSKIVELTKKFYFPKFLSALIYNASPIPELKKI